MARQLKVGSHAAIPANALVILDPSSGNACRTLAPCGPYSVALALWLGSNGKSTLAPVEPQCSSQCGIAKSNPNGLVSFWG